MFPPQYYLKIYLFILVIISVFSFRKYQLMTEEYHQVLINENQIPSIALTVIMILFIGTRPISGKYFLDMGGTASEWQYWDQGDVYHYQWHYTNIVYDNIRSFMSTYDMPVDFFFFLIATIYFSCIYIACRKLFPQDTLFALLVYLVAFSTFSYATNGIKAGVAAACFLIVIAYHENLKVMIPALLFSWGFHHSMIMVVFCFLCVYFLRKTKYYFYFWIFSFFVALAHITFFQRFFSGFSNDIGASYLIYQTHGKGFRIDFILYSVVPIIIGYYIVFIKKYQYKKYEILLNLYLLTNSIWMLCMYAEFTNRIAYLSWFLHPWVMIYPFLNEKVNNIQYHIVNYIALGHLCFTLFLMLIYWG